MGKQLLRAFCLVICAVFLVQPAWAVSVDQVPNPRQVNGGWVTDLADLLSSQAEGEINRMISNLQATNGSEVAVVTLELVPADTTPKAFATELFNQWGIGAAGQDNGVLFLVSLGDRRFEIETGYGAEAYLPDARVGRIRDQTILPYFRQENYEQGILAGTEEIVNTLATASFDPASAAPEPVIPWAMNGLAALVGGGGSLLSFARLKSRANRTEFVAPEGYTRLNDLQFDGSVLGLSWATAFMVMFAIAALAVPVFTTASVFSLFSLVPAVFISLVGAVVLGPILTAAARGGKRSSQHRPLSCAVSRNPMQPVAADVLEQRLTHPELVAQSLGSVRFEGWICPVCHPDGPQPHSPNSDRTADLHIFGYEQPSRYSLCPQCQEKTVSSQTHKIRRATTHRTGLERTDYACQACDYKDSKERVLPRLPPPVVVSGGPPSGGGGFGGGGSSGGGSFGGGSSGGGGAGGSW
ncbi:TPM domain-containing protein [Pseudanabaena sp. FACHB-2040]|uniref:TPM domain-containing protein n=1 Tax=Pseudanabaena sp. FACHB-2040 TaxID=2692859 RepID=UPI00168860BD|nr:TPM domain-containing protein [Pseudanabaena sp. FACHB-2040]MBD2257883.1 TPM domain-containing protein [Pseudanabaena sp. FACHB-2040]